MVAALVAARRGCGVTLFERHGQLGRKVLASGGGRCNLGNTRVDSSRYHGGDPEFVRQVLSRFGAQETLRLFEGLGLLVEEEADGRLFPRCGQARTVVEVLEAGLTAAGVELMLTCDVNEVRDAGRGFALVTRHGAVQFDRVVLSCGGASYPQLGGGARGYRLASGFGLDVTEPRPSLVPLVTRDAWVHRLQGNRLQVALSAEVEGRRLAASRGELLFTSYGISGPATLEISREVCRALESYDVVEGAIDLFPEHSAEGLREFLLARLDALQSVTVHEFLRGTMTDRIVAEFLAAHGVEFPARVRPTRETVALLARALGRWKFAICGHKPWDEAMVTAGGVRLSEVSPETMESTRRPWLYLTGELLDVDGDSGGFNLHFAWASGFLAGTACSAPS